MIEKQEILEIISDILGCSSDELDMQSGLLNHYLWDSLAHIEIIVGIERHFNLEIPDNEIEKLNSVHKIYNFLLENLATHHF